MIPRAIESKVKTLLLSKIKEFNSLSTWQLRIIVRSEWSYVLDDLTDEEYDYVFREMREENSFPSSTIQKLIEEVTDTAFPRR